MVILLNFQKKVFIFKVCENFYSGFGLILPE